MSSGEWILILAGLAIAAGLASLWRAAEARASGLVGANEKLSAEREDLAARLSQQSRTNKKQAEELAGFRKRADKTNKRAKKREAGSATDRPLGTASRVADLETELAQALRERDRGKLEREQLAAQVAELQARVEVSTRAAEVARTAPAQTVAAAPAASGLDGLEAELAEAAERIVKLENELGQAKEAEARMRKRMGNQEQLYASVRAELEVKKDRLRTQEEQIQRLEAMKVVVGD